MKTYTLDGVALDEVELETDFFILLEVQSINTICSHKISYMAQRLFRYLVILIISLSYPRVCSVNLPA